MKEQSQVCTFTLLKFHGWETLWIFSQMQKAPKKLKNVRGLRFSRLMGSGGKNGFSKTLNVHVFALHAVWDSHADADSFFQESSVFADLETKSSEFLTIYMRPTKAHGFWAGVNPYHVVESTQPGPVIVITRARIKIRHLLNFWRYVPSLAKKVGEQDGSLFSIGIGEYPWFMQATFSIWENAALMRAYAYESKLHTEVIRKTRELGWYAEELFANFEPYHAVGTWEGLERSIFKEFHPT